MGKTNDLEKLSEIIDNMKKGMKKYYDERFTSINKVKDDSFVIKALTRLETSQAQEENVITTFLELAETYLSFLEIKS